MLKAAPHAKLEGTVHQLYVQLSTLSMRGASEGPQCDCVVGWIEQSSRFDAARLLRIRVAIITVLIASNHSLLDLPCDHSL
jgi:hypothetical protein